MCEAFKRKIFNQGRSLPAEEDESQTEFPVPAGEGSVEERPSHVHPAAGASSRGEDGSGVEERPLAQLPLARQPGPGEDGSEVEERPLAQLPEAVHADGRVGGSCTSTRRPQRSRVGVRRVQNPLWNSVSLHEGMHSITGATNWICETVPLVRAL